MKAGVRGSLGLSRQSFTAYHAVRGQRERVRKPRHGCWHVPVAEELVADVDERLPQIGTNDLGRRPAVRDGLARICPAEAAYVDEKRVRLVFELQSPIVAVARRGLGMEEGERVDAGLSSA